MKKAFLEYLRELKSKPKGSIVMTYGTFDTFHYGHLQLLERASKFGEYLIVGLSTDECNTEKGKEAEFSYEVRYNWLNQLKCVDFIIPENCLGQKINDFMVYGVSTLVMGDDWKGRFDAECDISGVRPVYLPRTKGVSSTMIRGVTVEELQRNGENYK